MMVRVILEKSEGAVTVTRWERAGDSGDAQAFELLGRAFEVALREESTSLTAALRAFFAGAMLQKGDIQQAMDTLE